MLFVFNVWHRKASLIVYNSISNKNFIADCKALFCRLLLAACSTGSGGWPMCPSAFISASLLSVWLGVRLLCPASGLFLMYPAPPFCVSTVFCPQLVSHWAVVIRDMRWPLWLYSVGWDGVVVVREHAPSPFCLPAWPQVAWAARAGPGRFSQSPCPARSVGAGPSQSRPLLPQEASPDSSASHVHGPGPLPSLFSSLLFPCPVFSAPGNRGFTWPPLRVLAYTGSQSVLAVYSSCWEPWLTWDTAELAGPPSQLGKVSLCPLIAISPHFPHQSNPKKH